MNFWQLLRHEWQQIRHNRAVMLVLFGGILFYAFLYPLPYSHNVPGKQAVAVLDQNKTALSRALIRRVNATAQVHISQPVHSMAEAQQLLTSGQAHGLLIIPKSFQRDILLGTPTTLSYAGDASYFLIYGTVIEGLLSAGTTLALEMQGLRSLALKESSAPLSAQIQPIRVAVKPVFNTTGGYLNYVIPAVFVLILHQTLLITVGGATIQDRQRRHSNSPPIGYALIARTVIFMLLYLFFAALYFGVFFKLYGMVTVAGLLPLFTFTALFLLATILFSLLLGYLYTAAEQPILLVLVSSLPLVFMVGFAWPVTSLPSWLDVIANAVPARHGIQGLLALNQMGAPWHLLRHTILLLTLQCIVYAGLLAWRVASTTRQG